jgi:succinyl-diaminopimelate desuccinylase
MVKNGRRGLTLGKTDRQRRAGPHRLPASGEKPGPSGSAGDGRTGGTSGTTGNEFFPPTTWQVSNIHAGTGAGNVMPGSVEIDFNFRFGTASTSARQLQARAVRAARPPRPGPRHRLDAGARPFLTGRGALIDAALLAIAAETGIAAELSTSGGTSDGRFIADICPQVVEIGPVNASIHKVDECVEVAALPQLAAIYRRMIEELLPADV